jgi:hypothetical protein
VHWETIGVREKCKYFQIESGTIDATSDNGVSKPKHGHWTGAALSSDYDDTMGLAFNSYDTGRWTISVSEPLTIKVRCENSDGSGFIEQPIEVPASPSSVVYPPPTRPPHLP